MPRTRIDPDLRYPVQPDDCTAHVRPPFPGCVQRSRFAPTPTGFVLEVEELWNRDGDSWYCRVLIRADGADGSNSEPAVYCMGDW